MRGIPCLDSKRVILLSYWYMVVVEKKVIAIFREMGKCDDFQAVWKRYINFLVKNPRMAANLLSLFGFGRLLINEGSGILTGFSIYKVQSVDSWLSDLQNSNSAGRSLYQQLQPLSDKILKMTHQEHSIHYLKILVDCVNANPQILNPEIIIFNDPNDYLPGN